MISHLNFLSNICVTVDLDFIDGQGLNVSKVSATKTLRSMGLKVWNILTF
jgi:hypothetical protein